LWIVDTIITRFQILKQLIVSEGQVIAECRVVLAYKVIVVNSQLGNLSLDWTVLKLGEGA